MNIYLAPNTLYYGDCIDILRDFPSGCVDLICIGVLSTAGELGTHSTVTAARQPVDRQTDAAITL